MSNRIGRSVRDLIYSAILSATIMAKYTFFPKMGNPGYLIRNYRLEDFDKLVDLGAKFGRLRQDSCCASLQDWIEDLGKPDHFPEDNLFVAERAGNILGYVDVMPELGIGRVVLKYLVHPEHHRKGLAKRLVECGIQRARELRVKAAHVNIPQDDAMAKGLLSRMGFRCVRRYVELRLDLSEAHMPTLCHTLPRCHHLEPGQEERLTQIQNRSFVNTWGYNPNTKEEVIYRTGLPSSSPEDIVLAYEDDKPVGYCWTKTNVTEDKAMSGNKGRIYMLGVDPDHRGKGVGKQVLVAGLSHLKSKGIRTVELTMNSENEAACALYRSVGFEVCGSSLWYEKVLS